MKAIKILSISVLSTFIITTSVTDVAAQEELAKDVYGYDVMYPIPSKHGNPAKSLEYAEQFIKSLRTNNGESLEILKRKAVSQKVYSGKEVELTNRRGLPRARKLGIVDRYTVVTSETKDTLELYFDARQGGKPDAPDGFHILEQP